MAGHSSSMANTFDGARFALRRIRLHPSATLANSATGKAVPTYVCRHPERSGRAKSVCERALERVRLPS